MKRKIINTSDGSTTIYLEDWDESYHSKHGAINEAYHVFIKNGLEYVQHNEIYILEIGFGTGLNAFITLLESEKTNLKINYVGVERYPVSEDEVCKLNYVTELKANDRKHLFDLMHTVKWNEEHKITGSFSLLKRNQLFSNINDKEAFDLIYFDAFGARVQPELWTEDIFAIMFNALKSEGVLVTYAAKGSVRRAMQAVGFLVERLPGPPGKREMLRAVKQ